MQAAVAEGFKIEVPSKDRTGEFFVFFAGDLISDEVKAMNPGWAPGGNLYPGVLTLGHRLGYVRRCEITALRQAMVPENPMMVHPDKREFKVQKYLVHEGDQIQAAGDNGMLHTPVYPVDEIDRLTGQVDGMVRMPCADAAQAIAAQFFLFPHWNDLDRGHDDAGKPVELPVKINVLRAYFQKRKEAAQNEFQKQVADAALKSCSEFDTWCARTARWNNDIYQSMRTKGYAWPYGAEAELAFRQTNLQRADTALQEQSNKVDSMVDATTRLAETVERIVDRTTPQRGYDPALDAPPAFAGTSETVSVEDLAEFRKWQDVQAKEKEKEAKRLRAIVDGREVTVTNTNWMGKVKIEEDDGTKRVVEKEEVIFLNADQ